jgi:molecular chaperone DnaK (HSP70)
MPAVADRLRREFRWEPRLTDPDLAVAKGSALYATGQTVKFVDREGGAPGPDSAESSPGQAAPVTDAAVREVASRTGIDEDRIRAIAGRTIINVLPKAIGIKLIDTTKPGWMTAPDSAYYVEHLIEAQTQLPCEPRTLVAYTTGTHQEEVQIEIWEQAGASPSSDLDANRRVDDAGHIDGLGPFRLPANSPINVRISIDAEGIAHLHAIEPVSGRDLQMNVRISLLSPEQLEAAKANQRSLSIGTS